MKKKKTIEVILRSILLSILVMFILPLLTILFVKSDAGMAVCFILFFAVNPVHSVFIGINSGKNITKLWIMPIVTSIIFLISSWILFEFKEIAFVIYSVIYLLLSLFSMFISYIVEKNTSKEI